MILHWCAHLLHNQRLDFILFKMLAQPESSREAEKVVLDGFNKKLAIKVKAFGRCHPGVGIFTILYLPFF